MSEQEELVLYKRIRKNIIAAQKRMLERKARLGEYVVFADAAGMPRRVPARKALEFEDCRVS